MMETLRIARQHLSFGKVTVVSAFDGDDTQPIAIVETPPSADDTQSAVPVVQDDTARFVIEETQQPRWHEWLRRWLLTGQS